MKDTKKARSGPAPDTLKQARLLYDAGAPIADILKLLEMTAAQFRRYRDQHDWPLRAPVCARRRHGAVGETDLRHAEPLQDFAQEPAEAFAPAAMRAPLRPEAMIARLEDAVEREFARAEKALDKHAPKTIEASARTLASLVKTLAELRRMRREADERRELEDGAQNDNDAADADMPPRELAELKAELARRLDRLRGERPTE